MKYLITINNVFSYIDANSQNIQDAMFNAEKYWKISSILVSEI